jgi:phage terminase Nu1 subunit (DNA packaging protein)
MAQTFSMVELAALLDLNRTTVQKYVKQGLPYVQKADRDKGKDWKFSLPAVVEWLEQRAVDRVVGNTEGLTIDDAKLRKTAAEAQLAEFELEKVKRRTITVEEMSELVADEYATVRSQLLNIPGRLAQTLAAETDPAKIEALIKAEISTALTELSQDGRDADDADGAGSY